MLRNLLGIIYTDFEVKIYVLIYYAFVNYLKI